MIRIFNYTIKLWELESIKDIDFANSSFETINGIPIFNLKFSRKKTYCQLCGQHSLYVSGSKKKLIKHVLSNDSYAEILFHQRTFKCSQCGKYYSESLGDFISSRGVSIYLELAIINSLLKLSTTYKDVADKYHVSSTFVMNVFDRRVTVKSRKLPEVLSIDEIYARRLTKTKYCCVLFDPLNEKLVDVIESRRKDTLLPYFSRINRNEINNVKYIIIDLNDNYRQIAHKVFYKSIIVADSFHVIKNISEAFRLLRIKLMKSYENMRDITMEYWLFKKFHWMLTTNIDDIKKDYYDFKRWNMRLSKYQILDYMLSTDETLKEAYYLKERYRDFNRYTKIKPGDDTTEIRKQLDDIIESFLSARSNQMRQVGHMLFNWENEIINSFTYINNWRLSNSIIERYNGEIKMMMANAYGYTNFKRARNRMLFSINKNESVYISK